MRKNASTIFAEKFNDFGRNVNKHQGVIDGYNSEWAYDASIFRCGLGAVIPN